MVRGRGVHNFIKFKGDDPVPSQAEDRDKDKTTFKHQLCVNQPKKVVLLPQKMFQVSTNQYMGVSKNSGTPKWMVYKGKPY